MAARWLERRERERRRRNPILFYRFIEHCREQRKKETRAL
jgi:hypothetical protein